MTLATDVHLRKIDERWIAKDNETGLKAQGTSRVNALEALDKTLRQKHDSTSDSTPEINSKAKADVLEILEEHNVDHEFDEQLGVVKFWLGTRMAKNTKQEIRANVAENARNLEDYGVWNDWHWFHADVTTDK